MGEEGGIAAETHDESFSHAGHDIPFPPSLPFSLLSVDLLRRSFAICATRTSSLLVVPSSAEKQFSLHMSPTPVIVRFFSLFQTISADSHKKTKSKVYDSIRLLLRVL